jgi:hypothetical protein
VTFSIKALAWCRVLCDAFLSVAFPRLLKFLIIGLEDGLSRLSSLSCGVRRPAAKMSANGYVCKEITESSSYANVAPLRAGIKGSGQFPIR